MNEARDVLGQRVGGLGHLEADDLELELGARTERSLAEDLDMVQALSDFQARQTGYEAALKTYSMVQRLSLFQYL